jgi:hypothetical protein
LTASTTSSTWPFTLTFGQWRAILPVGLEDLAVGVRQQRERELVLVAELAVRGDRVLADAEDRCPELLQGGHRVPEALGLHGASRRVVARIEVEDDHLAGEVCELHLAAVARLERERRGLLANFDHGAVIHETLR